MQVAHEMKLGSSDKCHLTYCTNIHAGETWSEVRQNLGRYLPLVKDRVAPDQDFGVGLRLSAIAAEALRDGEDVLLEFQDFLAANGLYVFTINGFPYGPFHGTRVKEAVYLPDWQDQARLDYTNTLADLLAKLLPDDPELEGSVSTVPGAFKPRVASAAAAPRMASALLRHVAHLVSLREHCGRTIALALEPEPCCFLETIEETVAFFETFLFSAEAVAELADRTGLAAAAAEQAVRRHLGICYDTCHAAVEFEAAADSVTRLRNAGIRIAKLQLSAGLRIPHLSREAADHLRPFNDEVYLHQVVQRSRNGLTRFLDLPQAFEGLNDESLSSEWRVHFHVPIFREELGNFSSTQEFLREILALHRGKVISPHLEVETYTWDVLPPSFRDEEVEAAIARELAWVRDRLDA